MLELFILFSFSFAFFFLWWLSLQHNNMMTMIIHRQSGANNNNKFIAFSSSSSTTSTSYLCFLFVLHFICIYSLTIYSLIIAVANLLFFLFKKWKNDFMTHFWNKYFNLLFLYFSLFRFITKVEYWFCFAYTKRENWFAIYDNSKIEILFLCLSHFGLQPSTKQSNIHN